MHKILCLVLVLTTIACQKKVETRIPSISKGLANHRDFIAVDIVGKDSTYTVIILKEHLFDLLVKTKQSLTANDYQSFAEDCRRTVEEYASNGKPLHINDASEKYLKYRTLKQDSLLDDLLKMPKEQLIVKYFDKNVLRSENITFPQEKRIIYCLIKSGIRCWQQDYSGAIVIENPQ